MEYETYRDNNEIFISNMRPGQVSVLNFIYGERGKNCSFRLLYELKYDKWDLYLYSGSKPHWIYLEEFDYPIAALSWLELYYEKVVLEDENYGSC